jgi:hypothetical protein
VIPGCQRFVMSTFRQCRRVHTLHETLEFPGSNRFANPLESARARQRGNGHCLPTCSHCPPSSVTRVITHMNTKMILAAVALSLSLAACAKKEEATEAAQDAAATASDAAGEAQEAAGDAAAAAGDAAAAAGDAAAAAPAESTPPAGEQPAQPQQ